MTILIDLTSLADNFSGIERFAACLSLALIKNKGNDYILLFKEAVHPMFTEYMSAPNVKSVVLPRCNKLIFNQLRLPLAIYGQRADCYLFLAFPVPVLLLKRNMVSTIHDICCWDCPETMNHASALYFRISHWVALRKCTAIITISQFSEDRVVERLRANRKKLWRIYCGIDQKFLEYQKNGNVLWDKYDLPGRYILSLSTLEPRKNLSLLIHAYQRLVMEDSCDLPLVLAGRKGWKMDDLLSGVPETVKNQIHFTGFVDEEDLPALYANAELFVFPSMYEGFGIPPLEALACGTRVLSSDATSLPEVLGDAAAYFANNDAQSLYEKLKEMVFTERVLQKVSAGKKRAESFNWSEQAEELLKKIRSIAKK